MKTLNELTLSNKKRIIITNLMGYLRFLPSKKLWTSLKLDLSIGTTYKKSELENKLNILGYKKESLVTKTGEYAVRGYILDIFPYDYDNHVSNHASYDTWSQPQHNAYLLTRSESD